MINRILIYDPVPFKGGSKKMMKTVLAELSNNTQVWVLSNDDISWQECNVKLIKLFSPRFLVGKTTGFSYLLKQIIYSISVLVQIMRFGKFDRLISISGPCVDFALYIVNYFISINIIQLVQGNVANSRIAGYALLKANKVFYLPSTHQSLKRALKRYSKNACMMKNNFIPFINGIDSSTIRAKVDSKQLGFLWAASLLKWKRLELFLEAMDKLNTKQEYANKYYANICYIPPQTENNVDISAAQEQGNIHWYSDPDNLNEIRAHSSVFISTSEQEPFGLSILESMFAGLAIIIPADNAYWDQHLIDGFNCVKYKPNNITSLMKAITRLINDPELLLCISQQAKQSSQQYSHTHCYSKILKSIPN